MRNSIVVLVLSLAAGAQAVENRCTFTPTDRCQVLAYERCSPFCAAAVCCNDDSRRWVEASYQAEACGTTQPEWEISPAPNTPWPTHRAEIFPFGSGNIAFAMGECGDYLVRARAPETGTYSGEVRIHLPSPLCGDPECGVEGTPECGVE